MAKTEAQTNASRRYDSENLKYHQFDFKVEEDADIIEFIEDMKSHGYTYREIVNQLWENAE